MLASAQSHAEHLRSLTLHEAVGRPALDVVVAVHSDAVERETR